MMKVKHFLGTQLRREVAGISPDAIFPKIVQPPQLTMQRTENQNHFVLNVAATDTVLILVSRDSQYSVILSPGMGLAGLWMRRYFICASISFIAVGWILGSHPKYPSPPFPSTDWLSTRSVAATR